MDSRFLSTVFVVVLAAICTIAAMTRSAHAQSVIERDVSVWVTSFDSPQGEQVAYMFHEDAQGAFVSLGQFSGQTSVFSIRELLLNNQQIGDKVWFRGVSNVRMIHGYNPLFGEVPTQDVSSSPDIRRLVQHCVIKAGGRTPHDPCNRVWPIAAGHELTSYAFEDIGGNTAYAMQFSPDDTMTAANWLWANPAHIAIQNDHAWYLRFTLVFDIDVQADHHDVNVSWVSAVYCGHDFCLPSGQVTEKIGPEWEVPSGISGRIVAAVPVLQDHASWMRLMHNEDILFTATPEVPPQNQPAGHRCNEPDQPRTTWHTHAGHFDVGAMQSSVAMPGSSGPTFTAGDLLWVHAIYDVPDHIQQTANEPVNGRALWMVFWEPGQEGDSPTFLPAVRLPTTRRREYRRPQKPERAFFTPRAATVRYHWLDLCAPTRRAGVADAVQRPAPEAAAPRMRLNAWHEQRRNRLRMSVKPGLQASADPPFGAAWDGSRWRRLSSS